MKWQKDFEEKIENKLEKIKKSENRWRAIQSVFIAILVGILAFLLNGINDEFISIEHRLTELETKFDICIDCSGLKTKKLGDFEWETIRGYDYDEDGNVNLGIDIDILGEEYRWKCKSSSEIVQGENESVNFNSVIQGFTEDIHLKDTKALISVGTASSEGSNGDEEPRAGRRMETLMGKLESNLKQNTLPIDGLNIGKYSKDTNNKCSNSTLDERRVIILKVFKKKENLSNLTYTNAIIRILIDKAENPEIDFPIDIRKYSKYRNQTLVLRPGPRSNLK